MDNEALRPNPNIDQVISQFFERITLRHTDKRLLEAGHLGLRDLDEFVNAEGPWLAAIAGAPSMGRSALAQRIFLSSPRPDQRLFYSIDLSPEMLGMRFLTSEARVDSGRVVTDNLNERDIERLALVAERLAKQPITIVDSFNFTVDDIVEHARLMATTSAVSLLVIDGLDLLPTGDFDQGILKLRALSRELNCAVLITLPINTQLMSKRLNHRPMLSDLTISETIQYAADAIIGIYRDEVYNRETEEQGIMELIVMKQKNGPLGTVKVQFHSHHIRVNDLAPEGEW